MKLAPNVLWIYLFVINIDEGFMEIRIYGDELNISKGID